MNNLEKKLLFNELFNLYQNLLSDTQKSILNDYYNLDLSITEIAENLSITRSAVEDAISKGNKKLLGFEDKLFLLEKRNKILAELTHLEKRVGNCNEIDTIIKEIK